MGGRRFWGQWPAIRCLVFLELIELVLLRRHNYKSTIFLGTSCQLFLGLFSDYCIFFSFSTEPQVTYLIRKEFKMTNLDLDVDVLCGKTTIQWELLWLPKVPFLGWSAFSYYWRTARPFSCAPAHSSPLIWLSLQLTALLITKRRPLGTSSTLTFNNLCNQSKSNYSA